MRYYITKFDTWLDTSVYGLLVQDVITMISCLTVGILAFKITDYLRLL